MSGISGEHKFHFKDIPEEWMKVDVIKEVAPNVTLMVPNEGIDQEKLKDVIGTCIIWQEKYMKCLS